MGGEAICSDFLGTVSVTFGSWLKECQLVTVNMPFLPGILILRSALEPWALYQALFHLGFGQK